jgi:hypothetical protein
MGKERQLTRPITPSSVLSDIDNSDLRAIFTPAISSPGTEIHWINILYSKIACLDCTSIREFVFNNLVSSSFSSFQIKFHLRTPILTLFSLQKVPEQSKDDDLLSID